MSREEEAFLRYCSLNSCRNRLEHFLKRQKQGVAHFYRNDQGPGTFNLDTASARASTLVESVVRHKLLGDDDKIRELAKDLAVLALYDMAILIDDSESMSYEEDGARIEILKGVLNIINSIYKHAAKPDTGIRAIRFINNYDDKDYFHGEPSQIIDNHYFGGTTKIGTELHKKILKPLVLGDTPMKKPLLIMVITDGAIEGEKKGLLEKVIINCVNKLDNERENGAHSVAFQFSCIGNDKGARKVLEELDDHKVVGDYVNCQKATQSLDLSNDRSLTVTKLLLGAILYDKEEDDDELEDMMADIDIGDGESESEDSNGSNNHNTHIPQGQRREQGREYGAAPQDQFNHHSQANPHYQPAPPAQNQGAPYPQGGGFAYPPEPNPNPGTFSPNHSQPHFQENISGHPPGNSGPNQGPRPGQAYAGLGEAQRAIIDAQNVAREAREGAREAREEARRVSGGAEEIGSLFPRLGEGMRSPMSQEEFDEAEEELREETEDAESEGGHALGWPNPDVD